MAFSVSEDGGMKAGTANSILLALLLTVAGCYRWVPIKPTELPRLTRTTGWAQQPDGTTVEIVEPFDVNVATRSEWVGFKHPVASTLENRWLVVEGSNRGRTAIPLQDVTSVVVSQPDPGKTTAVAGVFLGIALVSLGALVWTITASSSMP